MNAKSVLFALSTTVLSAAVITHAYHKKQQFYPTMVYLTTSNKALGVLYIQAFVMIWHIVKALKYLFFGELRPVEVENLIERSFFVVLETFILLAAFHQELSLWFILKVSLLLVVKSFHWVANDRIDYMEMSPNISGLFHLRVISALVFLSVVDVLFIHKALDSIQSSGHFVDVVFGLEYGIMLTVAIGVFIKYVLHAIDLQSENPWENKTIYMRYSDIVLGVIRLMLYLGYMSFMLWVFSIPFHIARRIFITAKQLQKNVYDVITSHQAVRNLNTLYPDASPEDLEGAPVCIICREEMVSRCKLLPCKHVFHTACLRSWFQRQHTCPTCRMDVLQSTPPGWQTQEARAARAARLQRQQQQQQQNQRQNVQGARGVGGGGGINFPHHPLPPPLPPFPMMYPPPMMWPGAVPPQGVPPPNQQQHQQAPQEGAGAVRFQVGGDPQDQQQGPGNAGDGDNGAGDGERREAASGTGGGGAGVGDVPRSSSPSSPSPPSSQAQGMGPTPGGGIGGMGLPPFIPPGFSGPPFGMLPPQEAMRALSDEELRRLEGMERSNVEARITVLRNVQMLLDAAVAQLNQYTSVMTVLSPPAGPGFPGYPSPPSTVGPGQFHGQSPSQNQNRNQTAEETGSQPTASSATGSNVVSASVSSSAIPTLERQKPEETVGRGEVDQKGGEGMGEEEKGGKDEEEEEEGEEEEEEVKRKPQPSTPNEEARLHRLQRFYSEPDVKGMASSADSKQSS